MTIALSSITPPLRILVGAKLPCCLAFLEKGRIRNTGVNGRIGMVPYGCSLYRLRVQVQELSGPYDTWMDRIYRTHISYITGTVPAPNHVLASVLYI